MRVAYLDMVGGVSGDMLLGALVDVGLSLEDLRNTLEQLDTGGFELSASQVMRGGVRATLVQVDLDEAGKRVRHWDEFERLISASSLPAKVKKSALDVFELLAKAESAAHGTNKAETHLHELGTVDTLVDVVGVIAGLHLLGIEKVYASAFPLSSGMSNSSHGVMAATATATGAIYRMKNVPVSAGGGFGPRGEAVTPTGAALASTIAGFQPVRFTVSASGFGAGNRDPEEYPNVVGLWVGEAGSPMQRDLNVENDIRLLETNIDDMSGEALGYVQERLFTSGALDVWTSSIYMKKERPAVQLSVLCRADKEGDLIRLILRESTTLGVRRRSIERYVAERDLIRVETSYGEIHVKIRLLNGQITGIHPEYEDCRKLAILTGTPLRDISDAAVAAARAQFGA